MELKEKFNLADPANPILPEANLNLFAYRTMQGGNIDDALKLFAMIATAYPNSANAWDSYGEGCMAAGRYEESLAHYEKALELLPSDSTINPALRTAIEANAPGRVEELKRLIAEQAAGGQGDSTD
jgi:tetratricopeptide (TPR) repeat protein